MISAGRKIPIPEFFLDCIDCQSATDLFHSCLLASLLSSSCYRSGESAYTPSAFRKRRGGKTFAKNTKLFPTALPFFLPAPGVRAKHANPLSASARNDRYQPTKKGEF